MSQWKNCLALRDDPPWPDRGWEEPAWEDLAGQEEPWSEEIDELDVDLDVEPDLAAWRELDDQDRDEDDEPQEGQS